MHRPVVDSPRSWLLVGVAFTAMFVAVGTGYAYGALLLHLVDDLGIGPGTASGVFALTVFVFFLAGAPAGMLADRDGPRRVLLLGAAATAGGLLLTSTAPAAPLLFVGHGLLLGAGMATTFVPLLAVVAGAFDRYRTVAMGVAVSGIGVGTLVMAPLVAWLIDRLAWRPAYAVLAAASFVVLGLCAAVVPGASPSAERRRGGSTTRLEAFLDSDYRLLYGAQLLLAVALFIPFALLPAFAQSRGVAPVPAAGLVGALGLASVVGRLVLGAVADRVGVLTTYRGCYLVVGASFALWLLPDAGHGALLAFAVLFGVGYGGFVALLPSVVAERFGLAGFGALVGILYSANALGAAVGPWVAGALVDEHGYTPAALIGVGCGLTAFAVLARVRPSYP